MSDVIVTIESVEDKVIPPSRSRELMDIIQETLEDAVGYSIDIAGIDETGGYGFLIDSTDTSEVMFTIVEGLEMNVIFRVYAPAYIENKEEYLKEASKGAPSTGSSQGGARVSDSGLYKGNDKIWGGTDRDDALALFQMMRKELEG